MDTQEIINAISSVGFPIVACFCLFYLYDKIIKEIIQVMDDVKSTLFDINKTLDNLNKKLEDL